MTLRKYTNPMPIDLSQGLQDVLFRNGMQAHVVQDRERGGYLLIVQGHDSPIMQYSITEKQTADLMKWEGSFDKKNAYDTFVSIVKNDFHLPDNFVSARNANGRVVSGLHGYRLGVGEYGYKGRGIIGFQPISGRLCGWGGEVLGWTPREQPGFHMRRVHGKLFVGPSPMIPDRPDGRMKPGEMRSGGYGFYYKGNDVEGGHNPENLLKDERLLEEVDLQPLKPNPRPKDAATPYKDLIASPVYFTKEQWMKVLESHGIVLDEKNNRLTIQSAETKVDLQYSVSPEEMQKLLCNKVSGEGAVPVAERLNIINEVIKNDFKEGVTMDMLNTHDLIHINLFDHVKEEVEADFILREAQIQEQEEKKAMKEEYFRQNSAVREAYKQEFQRLSLDKEAVHGSYISRYMDNQGFYRSEKYGRDVIVGEIRVSMDEVNGKKHCLMTAEINGELQTKEISEKEYARFVNTDNRGKLVLFDKVFDEVKIKYGANQPGFDQMMVIAEINPDTGRFYTVEEVRILQANGDYTFGKDLQQYKDWKSFFYTGEHGKEAQIGEINVRKSGEDKYVMSAVIDGSEVSHEIDQKQYDKFLAVDDYQRMKMFCKVFPEIEMKTLPGHGVNFGSMLLGALIAGTEVMHGVADVKHMIEHAQEPCCMGAHVEPTIYMKAGVATPEEVVQRNLNTQYEMATGLEPGEEIHRGI